MADEKYIKLEDAVDEFHEWLSGAPYWNVSADDAEKILRGIPAADASSVVHARWLTKEYAYGTGFDDDDGDRWVELLAEYGDCAYCSNCKENAKLDGSEEYALTPFCPNCGAMMDGEG